MTVSHPPCSSTANIGPFYRNGAKMSCQLLKHHHYAQNPLNERNGLSLTVTRLAGGYRRSESTLHKLNVQWTRVCSAPLAINT
jgi:hypothetical protein